MEITKEMYEKIAHLFPKPKSPPKISNLEALNAILKVLENGSKWRSLGKNWHTIYTRANRWAKNNVLGKWANKRSEKLKVDSTQKYI